MECAVHPETDALEACGECKRMLCDGCLACQVDGRATCESCAQSVEARGAALGSSLLAFVGVGYLAALAIGFLVFKGRAFIGGLAAVVAIAVGRALQVFVRAPYVTRR